MHQLDTPRLHLRAMCGTDYQDFRAYARDPELCRLYGLPLLQDEQITRQIFDAFCQGGKTWALVHREANRMIGHLMAVPPELPADEHSALINCKGVTLAFAVSSAYQHQGLMTEALKAVIHHLFSRCGMDYIHCGCFAFNPVSAALQENLGFQLIGTHTLGKNNLLIQDRILYRE